MASEKLTELDALSTASTDDIFYLVDDPAGTPISKKITLSNLQGSITSVGSKSVASLVTLTGTQTLTNKTISDATITYRAATASTDGAVELATVAETDTGTDATRAVTPDGLAGSVYGEKAMQTVAFDFTTDTATGDGAAYIVIPSSMNGWNLVEVHAKVITAGTTGTTDIQIHNLTDTVDMLSTKLTIDSGETGSDTAATPAVIDTSNDDVASWDILRIDVDAVSTTAAKGLIITMVFRAP